MVGDNPLNLIYKDIEYLDPYRRLFINIILTCLYDLQYRLNNPVVTNYNVCSSLSAYKDAYRFIFDSKRKKLPIIDICDYCNIDYNVLRRTAELIINKKLHIPRIINIAGQKFDISSDC